MTNEIIIGKTQSGTAVSLLTALANRHGLITGATGTGKTVTLQRLAHELSKAGVSVFATDIKGDLSGICEPGTPSEKLNERLKRLSLSDFQFSKAPTQFFDVLRETGIPLRTTISDVGPIILSKLLDLNDIQSGVLQIAFKIADDESLPLLDQKDLLSLIQWISENTKELQEKYGNIAKSSLGAIQRNLIALDAEQISKFFGEPALSFEDLIVAHNGEGQVTLLDATSLYNHPKAYATVLLWILSELFEEMPEVGNLEVPKLVLFFDEAHLLFNDAPKVLLEKIEHVVRLIRSKGVGVYFITQSPLDIPETVLGQLGNKFQHALRAYTPKDKKTLKAVADSFRANPNFSTLDVLSELEVGEALVSTLTKDGTPNIVERVIIAPPTSKIGPATAEYRKSILSHSPLIAKYTEDIDRESAYELIQKRIAHKESPSGLGEQASKIGTSLFKSVFSSVIRTIGSKVGREIVRGVLGTVIKK